SGVTSTRYINGNLIRDYSATGAKTFDVGTSNLYTPATINPTTVSGGFPTQITVTAVDGAHASAPSTNAVAHYWTVTPLANTTADMTFTYGSVFTGTEAFYSLGVFSGGSWTYPSATFDTTTPGAHFT